MPHLSKVFFLLLVSSTCVLAESPFGVGLKAGVPLNDALATTPGGAISYFQSTHRFTIGPFVEFRLPGGFGVEIDALYRSYSFRQALAQSPSVSTNAWEFPVLATKSFFGGPISPYIEGGVALSHLSVRDVAELNHNNNYGIVLGAGISLNLGSLRVAPEIRYNGWAFQGFSSPFGGLHSNRNQATVLVGVSF
ncbi:MAG: outer membrane beta-barrel protein [Acidobacteriota bacterium]